MAIIGLGLAAASPTSHAAELKAEPGLAVAFSVAGSNSDVTVAPNFWLFVREGEAPTPFLPPGKFSALFEGVINADLRGEFFFDAELCGHLTLEINGGTSLEGASTGRAIPLSKSIKLNKGANPVKALFTGPDKGDAYLRLAWTEKGTNTGPIPAALLAHASTPALQKAVQRRLGRELFLAHRCVRCHTEKLTEASVPELKSDAPSFEGIGARRNYDWMGRWILDPKSLRPSAQMPRLRQGPLAPEEARAMAAFLASLTNGGQVKLPSGDYRTKQNPGKEGEDAAPPVETKPLHEALHCLTCHDSPDTKNPDRKKVSLRQVAEKFPVGKLAEFLRVPEAHCVWTRMPNFHLSAPEAKELESWLRAASPKPILSAAPTDAALIERGRKLVQSSGCLNCHSLKLENQYPEPSLARLFGRQLLERNKPLERDCLGSKPFADYNFSAEERAALLAFLPEGAVSLSRHVPAEFAERQMRALQCTACHGQIDSVPPLEILGGKLKPEWAAAFMAGDIPHKMRYDLHPRGEPWLDARMPSFKAFARDLATGMAAQHGIPPKTPAEPPIDLEAAKIGRKIVGKEGGLSCVSCHGIGSFLAMEVFESEGINLAYSADRLLPAYYRRWFRNPLAIDPQTKMPAYFDEEGKSPLTEYFDGDGEKQISAIWEYLRLRDKMPAPDTVAQ